MIERGFADALGLHVGDTFRLNSRPFRVAGIAVSTAQCFYPVSGPGVIWLTRGDAVALATSTEPLGYILNLKLGDPSYAQAFENGNAATAFGNATFNDATSFLSSWQDIEHSDFKVVAVDQKVLLIVSTLLALLAIASIAVVVGSRMAEQTRRVGLLKAVGGTPLMVAVVLLAENLVLALAATAVGVTVGQLVAPVLTNELRNRAAVIGTATVAGRVTHLVFLLSAILIVLAAINAIFTTWATVIDAQRPTALARALGATPTQITAGLTTSQLMPGLLAACLGIPLGLALYQVAGGHVSQASPSVLWLLAVIPGTLIVVAAVTAIPARIGARRPVAEALRSE